MPLRPTRSPQIAKKVRLGSKTIFGAVEPPHDLDALDALALRKVRRATA